MVEDPELPFPESVAASEIHKAGQQGSKAAKILFANMGFGALINALGQFNIFEPVKTFTINIGALGKSLLLRTSRNQNVTTVTTGGMSTFNSPAISPAYIGVGYIIGPRLAALNFAGGVLAWGLLVPLLTYLHGTSAASVAARGRHTSWGTLCGRRVLLDRASDRGGRHAGGRLLHAFPHAQAAWRGHGARHQRFEESPPQPVHCKPRSATERDLNMKVVFLGVALVFIAMIALYYYFIAGAGNLTASKIIGGAIGAAVVMVILGFFFAAVSGNLVGMIGSSNNPVSGLTLCTLVVAALLMVAWESPAPAAWPRCLGSRPWFAFHRRLPEKCCRT